MRSSINFRNTSLSSSTDPYLTSTPTHKRKDLVKEKIRINKLWKSDRTLIHVEHKEGRKLNLNSDRYRHSFQVLRYGKAIRIDPLLGKERLSTGSFRPMRRRETTAGWKLGFDLDIIINRRR